MTNHERSSCTGKARHESRRSARMERDRAKPPEVRRLLDVYRCAHCHGYHVGHGRAARQTMPTWLRELEA